MTWFWLRNNHRGGRLGAIRGLGAIDTDQGQWLRSDGTQPNLRGGCSFQIKSIFPESFRSLEPIKTSEFAIYHTEVSHCLSSGGHVCCTLAGLGEPAQTRRAGWAHHQRGLATRTWRLWGKQWFTSVYSTANSDVCVGSNDLTLSESICLIGKNP